MYIPARLYITKWAHPVSTLGPPWFEQFINLASKSHFDVNHGQVSYTDWVQVTEPFYVGRHRVVLIDTPGFDDTSLSDTDVLNIISVYLESSYVKLSLPAKKQRLNILTKHLPLCRYGQSVTLAGVLYFHDISAVRMGGIARRNFRMFEKLCGEAALENVVIVTNRWGEVKVGVGEAREAELMRENFYKPALDKGARMARHDDTALSAEEIIGLLLKNLPLPFRNDRKKPESVQHQKMKKPSRTKTTGDSFKIPIFYG